MYSLENEFLRITIIPKGAELVSLFNKQTGLEYMWSGDPAFWGKHSPVLFPIVGALKDGRYQYNGDWYELGRHGFARDMDFQVCEEETSHIVFCLFSNEHTRSHFPFAFEFRVCYTLNKDWLEVEYRVKNSGNSTMFFSVGAHPAFRIPLEPSFNYNDYSLEFNETETCDRWLIAEGGLISDRQENVLDNSNELQLDKSLFYKDAIVLKDLQSDEIVLRSPGQRGLHFRFPEFPFFGIWAAKEADFICLEPWCGIADSIHSSQQFEEKEGIRSLEPAHEFRRSWHVQTF